MSRFSLAWIRARTIRERRLARKTPARRIPRACTTLPRVTERPSTTHSSRSQATPAARETAAWAFRHHPTLVSREAISSEKRPERA